MRSCTALRSELQHRRTICSKHPHWLEHWFRSNRCNPIHPIKIGSHDLKLAATSESKTQEMPTRIRLCSCRLCTSHRSRRALSNASNTVSNHHAVGCFHQHSCIG